MARALVMPKGRITQIDSIEIDSCLDESHSLTNTVTDHPVEDGFNISDHVRPNPDMVTLRCFVSNTPLSAEQQERAIRQGNVDIRTTAAAGAEIGAADGRGDQTFAKLKKLRDEGKIIKVITSLKTYGVSSTEGMVIESLTIPRTRQNFDGLEFTVNLKQIRIVKNRSTRGQEVKQREINTRGKKKEGQKPTQEPAKKKTALKRDFDNNGITAKVVGFLR